MVESGFVAKLRNGLLQHPFLNLSSLRLLPIAPFFAVTIGAATIGVKPRIFIAATFLGLLPVEIALAYLGEGVKAEIALGRAPKVTDILGTQFMLPIITLGILALIPTIIGVLRRKNYT